VKVVQPATLVVKAVSPKRMMLAVLGSVFFFLLSLVLAYLMEIFDSSLRSPEDLARQIDTPIMVTLPKLPSKRALSGVDSF
jgi:capsular polysaccharide biosynthesis protein